MDRGTEKRKENKITLRKKRKERGGKLKLKNGNDHETWTQQSAVLYLLTYKCTTILLEEV